MKFGDMNPLNIAHKSYQVKKMSGVNWGHRGQIKVKLSKKSSKISNSQVKGGRIILLAQIDCKKITEHMWVTFDPKGQSS